ncbi:MAG TPA: dihydropteroate synthase [Holophaga sp.]|nr:dihydropteroate synthase [Holophaga sp.]
MVTGAWKTGAGRIDLAGPLPMGILNITPDSFSDGGRYQDPAAALAQARSLADQGARMLDVGAESTRPGAAPVGPGEEWARLEPVLALLRRELPHLPLSLDTRHAEVAARGLQAGVAVINDVTGFRDPALLHVAANGGCGLVAMRSRLEEDALLMPPYGNPGHLDAGAATEELAEVRDRVLGAGVDPERVLLDPGFGFGTTFGEDLALWNALGELPGLLDWPVERFCLGISRKRFLAWKAGSPALPAGERDPLAARLHREAAALGYRVFRTHAVTEPRIRPALAEDAPALGRVQVESWRATYRSILPAQLLASLSEDARAAAFREAIAAGGNRVWTLEARGAVQGFAVAGPCREAGVDPALTGEIHAIYLLPGAWGQGLGRVLLDRAVAGLREDGFREALLWVLERNGHARRFYERCGWSSWGAPRNAWMDGIALREVPYRLALEPRGDGL